MSCYVTFITLTSICILMVNHFIDDIARLLWSTDGEVLYSLRLDSKLNWYRKFFIVTVTDYAL